MLSYQHLYHAGNLADVQKHALLSWAVNYLTQKDKPLSYIETHAGRGLYDLGAEEAVRTGEAAAGIARAEALFPKDHPYLRILSDTRGLFGEMAYPGSPMVAALSLREQDHLHLAELHPREHAALTETFANWDADVQKRDGFEMAMSLTPPVPRRGLMLVDPSYEVKEDYEAIPGFLAKVARKWNVGILALWYPILTSGAHGAMVRAIRDGHENVFCHEVRFPQVREGHRMIGSGMVWINPPFGIEAEAARLDRIFHALAK
jgi:23S rRNA (adenine2030-N6)-methyltransferase